MQQERLMASLRQVQPVLMSRDVEGSIRFYAKLGFEVAFRDDPDRVRYAGVRRDGIELHLQWHDAKEWDFPNDRPTYRFVVDDVDRLCAEFHERGIRTDITDVRDTPWRTREFHVRDPDRNGLQFYRDL
jgi:catechol 2,3-dioxygenase-like lactoylglutathione lyase family enzyme